MTTEKGSSSRTLRHRRRVVLIGAACVGALALGAALGVGIAWIAGIERSDGDVPYPVSREASSEFEPSPSRRAPPPRVLIDPRADVVPPLVRSQPGKAEPGPEAGAGDPPPPSPGVREPAWVRNAAPAALTPGRPLIAVVIDDLGLDRRRTARAIRLPAPVTLAFLPYARDLPAQTGRARDEGHELLVHLSMEPESAAADPGPNALTVGLSPEELRARLDWALTRFPGYVGVNNHMGSRFTADPEGMTVVLRELKSRGLLFLDSRTSVRTVAARRARALGVPAASRHVFLDDALDRPTIERRLADLEAVARRAGYAVAIGHPHDVTLEALEDWLPTLEAKGFELVPVSAVVTRLMVAQEAAGQEGLPDVRDAPPRN